MNCPACGSENLPGADACEDCGFAFVGLLDGASAIGQPEDTRFEEHLRSTTLASLEASPAILLDRNDSVGRCILSMQEHGVAHVLVTDGTGEAIGIVTERDLLMKVQPSLSGTLGGEAVSTIMNPAPLMLDSTVSVSVLLNTMAVKGYRRVPVKGPEGYKVVTVRYLFNYLLALSKQLYGI
jgi:CBS domain-containing protein